MTSLSPQDRKPKSRAEIYKAMIDAAEKSSRVIEPPPIPIDPATLKELGVAAKFQLTATEQKQFTAAQQAWERVAAGIEAHTPQRAKAAWLADRNAAVAAALAGNPCQPKSMEEISADYAQQMAAFKLAAAKIAQDFAPTAHNIWRRWIEAVQKFGDDSAKRELGLLGQTPTKLLADGYTRYARRRLESNPPQSANWSASPARQLDCLL